MRISDWSSDVCSSDLMIQPSALAAFEDAAGAGDSHAIAEQLDIECGILGADAAVARLDREGAARSSDGHERLAADQGDAASAIDQRYAGPRINLDLDARHGREGSAFARHGAMIGTHFGPRGPEGRTTVGTGKRVEDRGNMVGPCLRK